MKKAKKMKAMVKWCCVLLFISFCLTHDAVADEEKNDEPVQDDNWNYFFVGALFAFPDLQDLDRFNERVGLDPLPFSIGMNFGFGQNFRLGAEESSRHHLYVNDNFSLINNDLNLDGKHAGVMAYYWLLMIGYGYELSSRFHLITDFGFGLGNWTYEIIDDRSPDRPSFDARVDTLNLPLQAQVGLIYVVSHNLFAEIAGQYHYGGIRLRETYSGDITDDQFNYDGLNFPGFILNIGFIL